MACLDCGPSLERSEAAFNMFSVFHSQEGRLHLRMHAGEQSFFFICQVPSIWGFSLGNVLVGGG